jgi:hypothetical protein
MKKLITTGFLAFAFFTFCFAQDSKDLYLFRKVEHAEVVVKVLNTELKFTESVFDRVRNLLTNSAKNEVEVFKNPENNKPGMVRVIVARQTASIEGALKSILGLDKYNIYLQKKDEIAKQVKLQEK